MSRGTNVKTENPKPKETPMQHNLTRITTAFLFASVIIACSLTMWATTPGHDAAANTGKMPATAAAFTPIGSSRPDGNFTACAGDSRVFIPPPFATEYSCVQLGTVPAVPFGWGALTFKYDDPNRSEEHTSE